MYMIMNDTFNGKGEGGDVGDRVGGLLQRKLEVAHQPRKGGLHLQHREVLAQARARSRLPSI